MASYKNRKELLPKEASATATSLELPDKLPFDQWRVAGLKLRDVGETLQWWVGDWLVYGDHHYEDNLVRQVASEALGLSEITINSIMWVARSVDKSRRVESLSWSHHRAVAGLQPSDQQEWLVKAGTLGWKANQLERAIHGVFAEKDSPETEHTRIQWYLLNLGSDMGFDPWVATDNRNASYDGNAFTDIPGLLDELPPQFASTDAHEIVKRIDVLWLKGKTVRRAFEIESTTAVYSGLLRMSDLVTLVPQLSIPLHIVAPSSRRDKVVREINRPTFRSSGMPKRCRLIVFEDLLKAIDSLGPASKHVQETYLDEISENCEVIDAD